MRLLKVIWKLLTDLVKASLGQISSHQMGEGLSCGRGVDVFWGSKKKHSKRQGLWRELSSTKTDPVLAGDHLSKKLWKKCLVWMTSPAKRLLKLSNSNTLWSRNICWAYVWVRLTALIRQLVWLLPLNTRWEGQFIGQVEICPSDKTEDVQFHQSIPFDKEKAIEKRGGPGESLHLIFKYCFLL